jgi:hypothetical protein
MAKSQRSKKITRRGEKVRVKKTDAALPVKPARGARPGPTVSAAVDRRKQIIDDEPKGRGR